jgi:hypothetical protein
LSSRRQKQKPRQQPNIKHQRCEQASSPTWAERWQAHGTVWAAAIAALALVVSVSGLVVQLLAYLDQRDSLNTEYSSRVAWRQINSVGDILIENRSTATLSYVNLEYFVASSDFISERTRQIFEQSVPGIFITSIPPCSTVEISREAASQQVLAAAEAAEVIAQRPALDDSDFEHFDAFFTGMVFSDPNGRWSVGAFEATPVESSKELYGAAPIDPINGGLLKIGAAADCANG